MADTEKNQSTDRVEKRNSPLSAKQLLWTMGVIAAVIIGLTIYFWEKGDPLKQLSNTPAALIPIEGCPGGFVLRAKTATVANADSIAMGVVNDLSAGAAADVEAADALVESKATQQSSLHSVFERHFVLDQSVKEGIWEQSVLFAQLLCILDRIENNTKVSVALRELATKKKIELAEAQQKYLYDVKAKNSPRLVLERIDDGSVYFTVSNYTDDSIPLKILSIVAEATCKHPGGKQSFTNEEHRYHLGNIILDRPQKTLEGDTLILKIDKGSSRSFSFNYISIPGFYDCTLSDIVISYLDPVTGKGLTLRCGQAVKEYMKAHGTELHSPKIDGDAALKEAALQVKQAGK
ncbi:hypothetical protein [Flavobacterium sp.]|uniref:hypothetical protein n=1 Tax=Flavobacterium sp. TaxID=239 RepID=UPI002613FBB9|nr:hypothetical protein [Flavobacterium sp.]